MNSAGYDFYQPLLRSSYGGYGSSSVTKDAEDLKEFISTCCEDADSIVLMGHSTGCQDIVTYLGKIHQNCAPPVVKVILQGPVSDREAVDAAVSRDSSGNLKAVLEEAMHSASHMELDEYLPSKTSVLFGRTGDPITAGRFSSLYGKQTEEDVFSSDLAEAYLKKRLGHITCPVLLILSEKDEFYPEYVQANTMGKLIGTGFTGHVEISVVRGADHFLTGLQDELGNLVVRFLNK